MLKNRLLRAVFESSRNAVSGERQNLCKEALLSLHSSTNIIREIDKECGGWGMQHEWGSYMHDSGV